MKDVNVKIKAVYSVSLTNHSREERVAFLDAVISAMSGRDLELWAVAGDYAELVRGILVQRNGTSTSVQT